MLCSVVGKVVRLSESYAEVLLEPSFASRGVPNMPHRHWKRKRLIYHIIVVGMERAREGGGGAGQTPHSNMCTGRQKHNLHDQ